MKQFILIGFLTGLLMARIPLRAQVAQRDSDARKGSRLELGRTPSSRKVSSPTLPSQRFSINAGLASSGLDRSISVNKNSAINAHYRSLLLPQPAAKSAARTSSTDNAASVSNELRSPGSLEPTEEGQSLYSNEKMWVSNAYPNPADDVAELDHKFNAPVNEAKIVLLNVLGAPVSAHELDRNEGKLRIMTRHFETGYYLYQLTVDGKKVATKRLLVRHQ